MKLSANDLLYAMSALANFLEAGTTTAEAMSEMQFLQPKHAEYWKSAAIQCRNGKSLSEVMSPIIDTATLVAITAAENSGTLPDVFTALEDVMEEKLITRKSLKSMIYPFAMVIAAFGVAIIYLGFVVPALAASQPNQSAKKSALNTVADILHTFLITYDKHIGIAIAATIAFGIYWFRNPENRNTLVSMIDGVPLLGNATRDIFYGEWAKHMAINTKAGITILDAIHLTYKMMPAFYHPEILAVANDMVRIGPAAAASPQLCDDPRNRLPFMIVNAFRFSEKIAPADKHFARAGKALITQGKKRIDIFVSAANNTLLPIAATMGAGAILPYFMQMAENFANLH